MKDRAAAAVHATGDWSPALYLKYEGERTRAARDLLAQVPLSDAAFVCDLGCGPGNSTELLRRRFPRAEILGLDTSEAMLEHARARVPDAAFVREDIESFAPARPPDVIFANASLHFLPDHQLLLPRLVAQLPVGGCLALQMPNATQEVSHALMRMIAADGPWRDRLMPVAKSRAVIADINDYYDWLRPISADLQVWRTTYVHPLEGPQGVVDWFAGSALRPFLRLLDPAERDMFLDQYRREIASEYETRVDGRILLPYPRVFIVAVK
ncbi:MAG: trans-aconitate 2-methyltransferase [Hyphomicrobiales bacterium]|nr:trans-aconitate 2-methyltransferase [Hyphomicrobiales bacterium]